MSVEVVGEFAGEKALETTLVCGPHRVTVMNYGGVIRRWQFEPSGQSVPVGASGVATGRSTKGRSTGGRSTTGSSAADEVSQGKIDTGLTAAGASLPVRDIVLGFASFDPYPQHSPSMGIMAGRVANRTRQGRFMFNGKQYSLSINHGEHHLHGGTRGLGKRLWTLDTDGSGQRAQLTLRSPDGDEGYPGEVLFTIDYALSETGLTCTMQALPSEPTPVNLAQHNYYNLNGRGTIRDHHLQIDAGHYLPVDASLIPTGEVATVTDTRFDFQTLRTVATADPEGLGHDHNLVLRQERDTAMPSATVVSGDGQVTLQVVTAQPGLQLYTAASLSTDIPGFHGEPYGPFAGLCLEAQLPPNILNTPDQALAIVTPDNPYYQALELRVSG